MLPEHAKGVRTMSILKNLRARMAPLNVKDLAELLNVTEGTIQRWVPAASSASDPRRRRYQI